MSASEPVIGIIGGTFTGNRGAESMLTGCIGRMKELIPNARFMVYTYYPKQDRELVHAPDIEVLSCKPASLVLRFFPFACLEWLANLFRLHLPDRMLTNVIRSLRQCDVLLDIGGVTFIDGREKYLPFNILTIWPAMMLKVPVVKLAQALGPFKSPVNRAAAKMFLPRCAAVFARGDITLKNLERLQLRNVLRAADVAFTYQPQDSLTSENEDLVAAFNQKIRRYRKEGKTLVAVSPSSLVHGKSPRYVSQLAQLVQTLAAENVRFIFLANSNRQSTDKSSNNDLVVLRALQDEIKRNLPASVFAATDWAIWDSNTRAQREFISQCDLLITSRFHAMVSGLALGVPTMVIGWSHKYTEVLADFGLEDYAIDYEKTGVDLGQIAASMLADKEKIRRQIKAKLPAVTALSQAQFLEVQRILQQKSVKSI